jgi:hypothetical protein
MTQKNVIINNNSTPCQQKQQYQKPQLKALVSASTQAKMCIKTHESNTYSGAS